MEEWLQTEWPELRVWLTSVTEHWATVAVVGPAPRERAARGCTGHRRRPRRLPVHDAARGRVAGIRARVCRVSFSGELAFEVNVDGRPRARAVGGGHGAGEPWITPYGTEAMHVLRAEKGYVIVGQDTDGTVTPLDLGLGWLVSKKKPDFVGRRSLPAPTPRGPTASSSSACCRSDPPDLLPEGAQLVRARTSAARRAT